MLAGNPSITMAMVDEFYDKEWLDWGWYGLSLKGFKIDEEKYIEKRMKEYIMAYRIQQYWFKAKYSPYYKIGRKLININYEKYSFKE